MRLFVPYLAIFAITVIPAAGESWPQWRGPFGTAVSPDNDTPVEWSQEHNIAWRTPLRGLGVSSPIVAGDSVFVTYQIGAVARSRRDPSLVRGRDAAAAGEFPLGGRRPEVTDKEIQLVVAAFERTTGRLVWEHEVAAEELPNEGHEKRNLATPSPVSDGERVYGWFSNGQLVALDHDGNELWSRHLGKEYGAYEAPWGQGSSPLLHGNYLILLSYHESTAYLLALDKLTGENLWKVDRPEGVYSYSTPVVVDSPNGEELIINSSDGVDAYDPATGKHLWRFAQATRDPIPAPVHDGGIVYMSRGWRSGPYLAIETGGRGNITDSHVLWQVETGAPYISSIVQYNGLIYMANADGIVTCVDAKTGERVWQERLGGIYTASPVAADGKIYLLSETGEAFVLRAGRKPEVIAKNQLDGQFLASPAIAESHLFVRSSEHLIAIAPN